MRGVLISAAKIIAFLAIWAALIAAVVMLAVTVGGQHWYSNIGWRLWVEIGGAAVTLAALAFMAFVVDKRGFA